MLISFLKKIKNIFYFMFIAIKHKIYDVLQMLGILVILVFVVIFDEPSIVNYTFLSLFVILIIFYVGLITRHEMLLYEIKKYNKEMVFIANMLQDVYNKVADLNNLTGFTLYVSQDVYNFIKKYDFINRIDIVIEDSRSGMSYGFIRKNDLINKFEDFFELTKN